MEATTQETGQLTGTKDKDYNGAEGGKDMLRKRLAGS
jgi:hypothetical protein